MEKGGLSGVKREADRGKRGLREEKEGLRDGEGG